MALIGIDLGTTNSLACVYKKGEIILIPNQFGKYQTLNKNALFTEDELSNYAPDFLEDGKIGMQF